MPPSAFDPPRRSARSVVTLADEAYDPVVPSSHPYSVQLFSSQFLLLHSKNIRFPSRHKKTCAQSCAVSLAGSDNASQGPLVRVPLIFPALSCLFYFEHSRVLVGKRVGGSRRGDGDVVT